MSDQQQILRLLATIREEVADIRTRQEELFEILVSYKDQIQDLKQTVETGLEGLPTSPYIAGQLVPAPDHIGGVDDFRQLIATYLHGPTPVTSDEAPIDVVRDPIAEVKPEDIELERDEDRPKRGRSRGRQEERSDPDLSRGPDRDIVALDLDEKPSKKRRRRRGKKKRVATDD